MPTPWDRRMLLLGENGTAETEIERNQQDRLPEQVERVDPGLVLGHSDDIGLQCPACCSFDSSYNLRVKRSVDEGMIVDATCFACGEMWSEER